MGYRIQARVGVQAPAFAVWEVISQLEGWKDWNPYITEAEGRLAIGALLQLRRRRLDGVDEMQEARVVDWVPEEQILFARSPGPFAQTLAFLEIEALSETACILAVGELFTGFLGERYGRKNRRKLHAGWQALAEAAKTRAETNWDGTPGASVAPPAPKKVSAAKKMKLQSMSVLGRRKPMG